MIWTEERKQLARQTCEAWKETPHRNRIAVPLIGVDCIRFVGEVLQSSEVISNFRFPYYSPGYGLFVTHNFLENIFSHLLFTETIEEPEFGALIVCRVGRATNHCGIVIDGKAWHVPFGSVVKGETMDTINIQSLLRITQDGFRNDPAKINVRGFANG